MTLSFRHRTRTTSISNVPFTTLFLHSTLPHGTCRIFTTTHLRSNGSQRTRREDQKPFSSGSSMPLSRLLHSSVNCSFHRSYCQISFLLSHPFSFIVQEKLLISHLGCFLRLPFSSFRGKFEFLGNDRSFGSGVESDTGQKLLISHLGSFSQLPFSSFRGKFMFLGSFSQLPFSSFLGKFKFLGNDRSFCSVGGVESDTESGESCVDPDEVNRVCKVINELFGLDRNMEVVLDECRVELSHDLVVDVLQRFKHARKPAFRFFCWAGKRPDFEHDSRTYNSMMCILGKTRQFETMVGMLEEMGEKGFLTMETFSIAIKAFAEAKERKKAVGIFDLMKKYKFRVGVDAVNFLLDSLGAAKLIKEAQVVYEKLQDRFVPNLQTYSILLNGWCKVKNLLEAGRVWNEMIDKGFKPDVVAHNIMLEGLLRCQKKSDGIKLFEVMRAKGPLPNVRSYTILIQDLCKQKMMREAVEYFDEMVDRGCQPDAALYTCLITGFGRQKKMDVVYDLLKEMRERGCPPDGRTYNALIKLMVSQHMPDDAVRVYKKMIQSGIEPTIHTYNMIMKSYFVTKNYEMGRAVWDEMCLKGCCPDDNSYVVFIGGLIRQGRPDEACKYIEEMLQKGMKAPQLDYNKFGSDFSKYGNPVILEELARKMNLAGKFEVSSVLASWVDMMKKNSKRREATESYRQFS